MAESSTQTLLQPEVLLSILPSKSSRQLTSNGAGKRKVRFSKYSDVREVLHRKHYTEEETELSWFSYSEKSQMRRKQQRILERLDAGETAGFYRGLECYTEIGHEELMENIQTYVEFVIKAQERLWEEGEGHNWELIDRVARKLSSHCKTAALGVAKEDAKRARKAYRSMGVDRKDLGSLQQATSSSSSSSTSSSSPSESSSSTKSKEKRKLVVKKKKKKKKSDSLSRRRSSTNLTPVRQVPEVIAKSCFVKECSITRTTSMPVNRAAEFRRNLLRTPSLPTARAA